MKVEWPDWIEPEVGAAFVEMRKAKGQRVPFTAYAAKKIILKLSLLRAEGYDPNACLDQSTVNGWAGVFPVHAGTAMVQDTPRPIADPPSEEDLKKFEADFVSRRKRPDGFTSIGGVSVRRR